jgi:hypothetical protein
VKEMLPNVNCINGVCLYPASKHLKACDNIGQLCSLKTRTQLEMSKTLAISSEVGLGATQLEKLRTGMKVEGVFLKLDSNVIKKIDKEVGIGTEMDSIFGTCEHFEDNGEPQLCKLHDTRLDKDICLEIESRCGGQEVRNFLRSHLWTVVQQAIKRE